VDELKQIRDAMTDPATAPATREALAREAKVSLQTIYRILDPEYSPNLSTVQSVYDALQRLRTRAAAPAEVPANG
jgi:DNA-binding phage protein